MGDHATLHDRRQFRPDPLHLFPAFVNISIVWRQLRAKQPSSGLDRRRGRDRDWYKWPRSNLSNPFRRLSLWKEGGKRHEKRDRWSKHGRMDVSSTSLSVPSPNPVSFSAGKGLLPSAADCSRPSAGHASRVANTFWNTLYYDLKT